MPDQKGKLKHTHSLNYYCYLNDLVGLYTAICINHAKPHLKFWKKPTYNFKKQSSRN